MHVQRVSWGGLAALQLVALQPWGSVSGNHTALQMSNTDLSVDNGFAMRNYTRDWALTHLTGERQCLSGSEWSGC